MSQEVLDSHNLNINRDVRDSSANSKRMQRKNSFSGQLQIQPKKIISKDKTKETQNLKYTPIKIPSLKSGHQIQTISLNKQQTGVKKAYDHELNDKQKSERSIVLNKHYKVSNQDSQSYYKFWKEKANEYQSMNFNLQRLNSALQQELQILKHHNQKLLKKISKQNDEVQQHYDDPLDKEKMEKFYKHKIETLTKKIEDQQRVIRKQEQKLRELSKQMSENYQLKGFLQNMEERVSEIESIEADKKSISSRKNSIQQIPLACYLSVNDGHTKSYTTLMTPHTDRLMSKQGSTKNMLSPNIQTSGLKSEKFRLIHKSRSNSNLNLKLK